ncbi:MAG: hypothetical protein AB8B55_09675 [Mariniblastus sp.]
MGAELVVSSVLLLEYTEKDPIKDRLRILIARASLFAYKLIGTLLAMGVLVFGSTLLGSVPMPDLHKFCGAWG